MCISWTIKCLKAITLLIILYMQSQGCLTENTVELPVSLALLTIRVQLSQYWCLVAANAGPSGRAV